MINLKQFHRFLEFVGSIIQSVVTPNDDWSPILSNDHRLFLDAASAVDLGSLLMIGNLEK